MALRCAARGANIILSARRIDELKALGTACEAAGAGSAHVLGLDLTKMTSAAAEIRKASALHGSIDLVILNAGVDSRGAAVGTTDEALRRVFEVSSGPRFKQASDGTDGAFRRLTPLAQFGSAVLWRATCKKDFLASRHPVGGGFW